MERPATALSSQRADITQELSSLRSEKEALAFEVVRARESEDMRRYEKRRLQKQMKAVAAREKHERRHRVKAEREVMRLREVLSRRLAKQEGVTMAEAQAEEGLTHTSQFQRRTFTLPSGDKIRMLETSEDSSEGGVPMAPLYREGSLRLEDREHVVLSPVSQAA